MFGRGEWIRTTGLLVPNQALYQAEPRPDGKRYNLGQDSSCIGQYSIRALLTLLNKMVDGRLAIQHLYQ
jgi:hypothetical protein